VKKVFVSYNLDEAYRIRDVLRENGIAADVTNEALMTGFGQLPMDISTLPTVWIAQPEREREADELVRAALEPVDRPAWRCEKCEHVNGGPFTDCPTCGAPRPDSD
jgi:hypothetical protein